jgi:hypothetical protein
MMTRPKRYVRRRPRVLGGSGLRCPLPARPTHRRPLHPVLVHRLAPLIHASFRPRLATTPLRFSSPSPPPGWAGDFLPPSCRTCSAHKENGREKTPGRLVAPLQNILSRSLIWVGRLKVCIFRRAGAGFTAEAVVKQAERFQHALFAGCQVRVGKRGLGNGVASG